MKFCQIFFYLLLAGVLLTACEGKTQPYVYEGKVDSAAIGLTNGADTVTKAQFPRPEMPAGLVIDSGSADPFAADSAYLPPATAPLDDRDRVSPFATPQQNP